MTKFLTCLWACFCLSHPVLAWNAQGHMVVAQIAYNHLDSEVKAKCDALIAVNLGSLTSASSSTFVTAACWADDFKGTLGTGNWHYIDIPFSLDGYPTNGFVADSFDVVQAIRLCVSTLQDPTAAQTNQAAALRYLIHFVGDIQQPLQCSTAISTNRQNGDAGGNSFSLNGTWSNLHSLWDSGGGYISTFYSRPLSAADQTAISNKAAAIEAAYPYSASIGTIPDPMDGAQEGWGLAQTVTYVGITRNTSPSASYLNTAQSTTVQRMALGGQRLAKLLSTIFVTNAPILTSVTLTNDNFGVSWSAVPRRIYRIQWKQQTNDAVWNDLTDITASTNWISFTDAGTETQRFYRVYVLN